MKLLGFRRFGSQPSQDQQQQQQDQEQQPDQQQPQPRKFGFRPLQQPAAAAAPPKKKKGKRQLNESKIEELSAKQAMMNLSINTPVSLSDMVIGSVDTLCESHVSQEIEEEFTIPVSITGTSAITAAASAAVYWNDSLPLIQPAETPAALKTLLRLGVPPALRCAIWLSNVVQAVHPHLDAKHWHEYRTLAKAQALGHAYDVLIQPMIDPPPADLTGLRERTEYMQNAWEQRPGPSFRSRVWQDIPGTTRNGRLAHKRVLLALEKLLGMEYAPAVPTICALLLTAQSEAYAFCALREMTHQPDFYFAMTPIEQQAYTTAFADIITKLHPQTAEYLQDRGILDNLDPIFVHFFAHHMPLHHVQRIMDIYTLEGSIVLFRFGVALFVLFKIYSAEQLLTISNAKDWWHYFRQWTFQQLQDNNLLDNTTDILTSESNLNESTNNQQDQSTNNSNNSQVEAFDFDLMVRKAYGVHGRGIRREQMKFPTRSILQRILRMEEERLQQENWQEPPQQQLQSNQMDGSSHLLLYQDAPSQPLGLVEPSLPTGQDGNHPLLFQDQKPAIPILAKSTQVRMTLASWIPITLRLNNLDLLYSTNHHGRSLEMFYTHVQHAKHTILLCEVLSAPVKTVIGMYASQAWRNSTKVYGDGSCFLFRLEPTAVCWKWKPNACAPAQGSAVLLTNLSEGTDDGDDNNNNNVINVDEMNTANNSIALLEQFMVSTTKYISMGGNPDGSAGLRLNEDFTMGESSTAAGFDNEPLHGLHHSSVFEVGLVEVYGFVRQMDGRAV